MNLQEMIDKLNLTPLTLNRKFDEIYPSGGYASDLLSCVMSGAKPQNLWLTLQAHVNIIAVAALLDLSAVIITEDAQPDAATIARANEQNVVLLSTPQTTYELAGRLWELGVAKG